MTVAFFLDRYGAGIDPHKKGWKARTPDAIPIIAKENMNGQGWKSLFSAAAVAVFPVGMLLIAGCAGEKPVSSLNNAQYAIQRAHDAKADQYASAEMGMAEEKMGQARTASGHEDYTRARRLADEAKADAEAAEAKARSQTAQQEARGMQKTRERPWANISPPPATMGTE